MDFVDRVMQTFKQTRRKAGSGATTKTGPIGPVADTLTVTKQADGRYRWLLFSSGAYEDRDREIVSQKSLAADVDRADVDGDYGPLLWWHEKALRLGECDFNMLYSRTLIESGTFDDERVALAVKEHAAELGVSIGFSHPASEPDADGVFHTIKRFERSLLPAAMASYPFSAVPMIEKESQMTAIEDKLKALGHILSAGPEAVKAVLEDARAREEKATAAGTRTKAKGDKPDADAANEPPGDDAAADKPFTKDEATDETKPDKTKKSTDPELTLASFKALLDESLAGIRGEFTAAIATQATTKSQADAALAVTLKDYESKLDGVAAKVQAALDGVGELKGELPRRLGERQKGWQASQEGDPPSPELAGAAPAGDDADFDGMGKHWKALRAAAGAKA